MSLVRLTGLKWPLLFTLSGKRGKERAEKGDMMQGTDQPRNGQHNENQGRLKVHKILRLLPVHDHEENALDGPCSKYKVVHLEPPTTAMYQIHLATYPFSQFYNLTFSKALPAMFN